MSPTSRQTLLLAHQDHLSPIEDLDLDEIDVSLLSETETEETPKTTTPVEEKCSHVADTCGLLHEYDFSMWNARIKLYLQIFSMRYRCICPSILDRRKRFTAIKEQQDTDNDNRKSSMFTVTSCCIARKNDSIAISPLLGNENGNEQRCDDELFSSINHPNSRSRPLILPSSERSGCNNEPNCITNGREYVTSTVQLEQPKRQPRPTELFLPTKQLENGHSDTKSKNTSYMEQFWICTKRLLILNSHF